MPIAHRTILGVPFALATAAVWIACSREPLPREAPTAPTEEAPPFIATPPATRRDSLLAVRQLARFIAVGVADSVVRIGFLEALGEMGAAQDHPSARTFFRGTGTSLAREIERANHLEAGDLDRALAHLPELDLTLRGLGGDELLVTASLEPGQPAGCGGNQAIGYDHRGWERSICPDSAPVELLLVLAPSGTGINPGRKSS